MFDNNFLIALLFIILLIIFISSNTDCKTENFDNDRCSVLRKKYSVLPQCRKLNPDHIAKLTENKIKTNRFLKSKGYPVPNGLYLDKKNKIK